MDPLVGGYSSCTNASVASICGRPNVKATNRPGVGVPLTTTSAFHYDICGHCSRLALTQNPHDTVYSSPHSHHLLFNHRTPKDSTAAHIGRLSRSSRQYLGDSCCEVNTPCYGIQRCAEGL